MRLLCIFFLTSLLIACQSSTNNVEQRLKNPSQTTIFQSYLQRNFKTVIPDSSHCYILVPRMGCIGCMQQTIIQLNAIFLEVSTDQFTIISSSDEKVITSLFEGYDYRIWYDRKGELDLLNLRIADVMIVKTQHKKLISIVSITPKDLSNIERFLPAFHSEKHVKP